MDVEKILQISLAVGIPIGFLLIFSLIRRRSNQLANYLLGCVLSCQIYDQVVSYLLYTGEIVRYPFLFRSNYPLTLAAAALLYLYTCALTVPDFKLKKEHRVLFVPAMFGLIWYGGIAVGLKQFDLWTVSPVYMQERFVRMGIGLPIYAFFLFGCFKVIASHRAHLKDYFSELEKVRLTWLYVLLGGFLGLWILGVVDFLLGPSIALWHIFIPLLTLQLYILALFTLRQSVIFSGELIWNETKGERSTNSSKTFAFTDSDLNRWKAKLATHMINAKPYLNPELRLSDLASDLKLKPYQLSELINRGEQTNFYDFINRYRIDEAKRRLRDPAFLNLNILGIAQESGFNSKSVFNDSFKKLTGLTPSAFRGK